jgi:RNA polymerase sigma-70 factor (ECF subfamily)
MDALRPALTADRESINYRHIASQLDVTETAARVAVHRLRQRYRLLIQTEVAHTVTSPDQVAAEMRHLFQILAAR